ncbi:hypothetical protein CONPUDRAFT_34413, partial [Coniophora puteana RWD-64-598 SS2]
DQPSLCLQEHCPLCFGGDDWHADRGAADLPDCIVCIDACFAQKWSSAHHESNNHDPPNPTHSVFIDETTVAAVDAKCKKQQGRPYGANQDDFVEPGMYIPTSVLDGCGESFVAADEQRQKASTCFFLILA